MSKLTAEQQVDILWKALCADKFWVAGNEIKRFSGSGSDFSFWAFENIDGNVGDDDLADLDAPTRNEVIEKIAVWLMKHRLTE